MRWLKAEMVPMFKGNKFKIILHGVTKCCILALMKMIRHIHKENINDIPKINEYINKKAALRYHNVLNEALENYLGRPFDLIQDANKLTSKIYPNGDTEYFVQDVLIGTMRTGSVYDGDDFPKDKITFFITFTPAIK